MKRTYKKGLSLLLALVMVLSLLPMTALALDMGAQPTGDTPYLTSLSVDGYTFKENEGVFSKYLTAYSVTVPNNVTTVTINATGESGVAVFGAGPKWLNEGANVITVQAENESASLFYRVTVYRTTSDATDPAEFKSFTLTHEGGGQTGRAGVIDQGAGTIAVSAALNEASAMEVSFETVQANATVSYDGQTITSGSMTLDFSTPKTFTVTYDADGEGWEEPVSKSYIVTVTEEGVAAQPYEIIYKASGHYNVGDTVSYDVYARTAGVENFLYAHALDIGSFQFTANYDSTNLTYNTDGFTPAHPGTLKTNSAETDGKVVIGFVAEDAIPVPYYYANGYFVGFVKLGTLSYTVKNDIAEQTTLLDEAVIDNGAEITPNGYNSNSGVISEIADNAGVYVHNNIATFQNNHTTGVPENCKAYVKHGEAGFYTSNAYDEAFDVPTVTAEAGYRLVNGAGENLWHVVTANQYLMEIGDYADADTLAAATLIYEIQPNNVIITPNVLWQVDVTFASADENKGTVSAAENMTLVNTYDEGMKLTDDPDYTMPTTHPVAGYKFAGWTLDATAQEITYLDLEEYVVPGATQAAYTIYAVFVNADYTWHDEDDATTTTAIVSGVDTINNNQIVHGTPIVFTVAPDDEDHYIITKVEYSVGEGGKKHELDVDSDGRYTVPGDAIIGDVHLHVTTNHFVTLTYQQGTGVADTAFHFLKVTGRDEETGNATYEMEGNAPKTFTAAEIYVKHGEAGLYADKACTVSIELLSPEPVPEGVDASSRFRSPTNQSDTEYAWVSGDDHYHTAATEEGTLDAVFETAFTTDATLTSRAIQQFKVNFVIGEIGEVGSGVYGANFGTWDDIQFTINEGTATITATGDTFAEGTYIVEGDTLTVTEGGATYTNTVNAPIRETSEWYDVGTTLTTGYADEVYTGNVPQTFLEAGYIGGAWAPPLENVTESTGYTFTVGHGVYNISFNDTDEVTYSDYANVTNPVNDPDTNVTTGTVTHTAEDGDVKFKAEGIADDTAGETSFVMTELVITIDGEIYPVTPDEDGFYVIPGEDITGEVVITPTTVEYVKVTFAGDEGASGAAATAYARAGVAGLFTDTTFGTAFTVPAPTAKENYRLYDVNPLTAQYWTTGGETPAYVNAGTIGTTDLDGNTTYTATTVKTITITFTAPVNGTLNGEAAAPASITFDDGTALGALTDPAFPAAAPNTGFAYTGWTHDNGPAAAGDDVSIVALDIAATELGWLETGSYTFTAVFTELSFKWLPSILENAAIDASYPTGIEWNGAGTEDDTVTYGTPVTFKLTAGASHAIRVDGVRYQVGDGDWVTMTATEGLYTIPGNAILGDVQISVVATPYVVITFAADAGKNTISGEQDVEAYAVSGTAGLYSSLETFIAGTADTFTIPVPQAAAGYRLMKDIGGGEELWITDGDKLLTSTGAAGEMYTTDTTLTARSQKTWDVTYAVYTPYTDPNSKGTLTLGGSVAQSTVTITVDDQHFLTSAEIPATNPDSGYQFNNWSYGVDDAAPSLVNQQITADITYTANFKHGEYDLYYTSAIAAFTPGAGVTGTGSPYGVTHASAANFNIVHTGANRITGITYSVAGGVQNQPLAATGTGYYDYDGDYSIPVEHIVGDVTITVTSIGTHTVSFVSGGNGTLTGETQFVVDNDSTLGGKIANLDGVIRDADTAYNFLEWRLGSTTGTVMTEAQILAAPVIADVTYYAIFNSPARTITDVNSVIEEYIAGYEGNEAFYNQAVTFEVKETMVVTEIKYQVDDSGNGEFGDLVTLAPNADGSYTIPGTAIIGNVRIIATILTTGDGGTALSMEFILRDEYKAIVAETSGKKILVLNGAIAGDTYKLADGTELYWSSKYNAAVCWVDDDETAATLAPGMTVTTEAASAIAYDGNINGLGAVTAADAMIISDCLHDQRLVPTSAMQLFELDVEDTREPNAGVWSGTDGYKCVTASDVTWTLHKAVNP